ncbi:MAG: radical SAM protein [Myxococcales bacterium]|nr:radical SAM protein [Polyangiaceae bacterium]MDW8250409.1 radical SAM protein [Myxococcales bacterium]
MVQIPPRPRHLPIAPEAGPARRRLPLAGPVRPIDRKWQPVYAVWEITLRCDLTCRHCGSRAGRARPDELTTAECLDLVRQMAELGVREVTMIGGEAYLRDDWTEIARAIRAHGMQCGITTGGRGFTPERARQAREAGVQSVSVSVDGLQETHDKIRGVQGSYDAAMAALENLRAAGVPVSANTQFFRYNLHEIPEVLEQLIERKIHSWQVQITVAMGRAADEPEMLLQPYQMLELMPMLARLKRRADQARVRIWPGNNIGYFGPYESALRGTLPRGHMASCGAGRSTLGIEANGDIKGCPSLPSADYVGGNIRDHSLREIWEQTTPLRFTRDRTVDDLWGFCRSCYYADTCRAGCSWTSHVLLGRPGNNPYCHHRALELLREGKRERVVRLAPAPGEPFDYGRFQIVEEPWPQDELAWAQELATCPEF